MTNDVATPAAQTRSDIVTDDSDNVTGHSDDS